MPGQKLSVCHLPAGFRAIAAGFRAFFAMLHSHTGVFFTFFGTTVTYIGAQLAKLFGQFAIQAHYLCCGAADNGTLQIQLNTFCKMMNIFFL
jgi:hypothetical protein